MNIIIWGVLAAALIGAGFACDGATEIGHHFFLIVGGVAIGCGMPKRKPQARKAGVCPG